MNKKKPISGFNGPKAKSYTSIFEEYTSGTDERESPQKNPTAAYREQRRNICTFDQFIEFAGLTVESGKGPTGETIPMYINGDYMDKRNKIKTYVRKYKKKEEGKEAEGDKKQQKDQKAEAASSAGQGKAPEVQQPAQNNNAGNNQGNAQSGNNAAWDNKADSNAGKDAQGKDGQKRLNPRRDTRYERPVQNNNYDLVVEERDLRSILKEVSKELFSRQVYA